MDRQAAAAAENRADPAAQMIQAQAAQIQALQAQLNLFAINPQPAAPLLVQQVNPYTVTVPGPFNSGDIVEWLDRCEACADANGWTPEQRLQRIPPYLTNQANLLYRRLPPGKRNNWANLQTNLILWNLYGAILSYGNPYSTYN